MTDVTRIVGEIRMFLQSIDRTAQPHLPGLAVELARACAEANERLNRCAAYLRQGLRTEALQLARSSPDLLDQVAALDFPERGDWDDLAVSYGWRNAPPLAMDLAQAVNEAYALDDPLQDLLRAHRRMALARAPLAERIDVMRQLCTLDSSNPMWADDVRRFESARMEQIEREARKSRAQLDAPTLAALLGEVESSLWLNPPPESLVTSVRDAVSAVKREEARRGLRSLVTPLDQARLASDVALGRQLRERWSTLRKDAALSARDALNGEALVALDWLEAEDRREAHEQAFRAALNELEQALEDGAPGPALTALEQTAREFGLNFPHDLESRLHDHQRQQGRAERRRNHLILAAVSGTTLLLVGLAAWANAIQKRDRDLHQGVGRIESDLEKGRFKEARSTLDALELSYRGVSEDSALVPTVRRLTIAERHESEREEKFHAALSAAREAPDIQEDVPALAAARLLARLDAEKVEVERLIDQRRAASGIERTRLDREVGERLQTVQGRLATAEELIPRTPLDSQPLANARRELREIESAAKRAGDAMQARVAVMLRRLGDLEAARFATIEREQLLKDLERNARAIRRPDDVEDYIVSCRRYKDKFTSEPRSKDLIKAIEDQAAWEGVAAWAAMARSWPAPLTSMTAKVAAERLQQLASLGDDLTRFPDHELIARYRRYVESRARLAVPGDENPTSRLERLLSNPLVRRVFRLTTIQGLSFYSLKPPQETPAGTRVYKLISLDCDEKQQFFDKTLVASQGPAPQVALARRLEGVLDQVSDTPGQWDVKMLEILNLIRKEPDINPVLKVILLKGGLEAAAQGNSCLAEALQRHADRIDKARVHLNVIWVDPDDITARQECERARDLLAKFPAFDDCIKNADAIRRQLDVESGRYYTPIGLLVKAPNGSWQCRTAANGVKSEELWVLGPQRVWRRVGKGLGLGEEPEILTDSAELIEGRLVFTRHAVR